MRFEYDNKLELTYAAERAEILSDLLLIGFENTYTESLIGGGEAVGKAVGFAVTAPFKAAGMAYRGAKNAKGLVKQGAERLRSEKNKLMNLSTRVRQDCETTMQIFVDGCVFNNNL